MPTLEPLLAIARDLTASLASEDRYQRLLAKAGELIPFDAACLLRLEGDELVPLAGVGLQPRALELRYQRQAHPRLDCILAADGPVRFATDSPLPDPFDGLLIDDQHDVHGIHACLGCPLQDGDELVGALTADAMAPDAFAALDEDLLATLGALAGAALRTSTLIDTLERLADHRGLVARDMLATHVAHNGAFLGQSPAARGVLQQVDLVAGTDLPVLITGATGVGKELIAHLVHQRSRRHDEACIEVNCAALPTSLAESELFGHAAGAFTGASAHRAGKFEIADGGTLFLDEIGELPPETQAALLRTLQSGEIQRLGSDRRRRVDVRIVAATNRDLEEEIAAGRFRADLYHRLAAFPIHVPELAERRQDIPLLAYHFAEQSRRRLGLTSLQVAPESIAALEQAAWPGNVRELANVVGRGVLLAAAEDRDATRLRPRHLRLDRSRQADETTTTHRKATEAITDDRPLRQQVDDYQRRLIASSVEACNGNWAAAARRLGLQRSNLHHLAKRLGLR